MADQTYADVNAKQIIVEDPENIAGHYIEVMTLSVGAATTTAGMVVTCGSETYPAVDQAVTTDACFWGVVLKPVNPDEDYDLDDTIADGTSVYVLKAHGVAGRVCVLLRLEATAGPVAQVPGEYAALGTEGGKIRKLVYADATDATDTLSEVVGVFGQADAGDATNDTMIRVWLGAK